MTVYYPNPSTEPTTCQQTGTAEPDTGSLVVALARGTCENGRELTAAKLTCNQQTSDSITCTIVTEAGLMGALKFLAKSDHEPGSK